MHDLTTPTPRPRSRPSPRCRLTVPALALALLLGVAACTGGGADSGGSTGSSLADSAGGAAGGAPAAAGTAVGGAQAAGAGADVAGAVAAERAVVSTATLGVRVDDLDAAGEQVQRLATDAGGLVTASQAGGAGDDASAHLVLRVPGPRFAGVLDDVAALGEQTDRTTTSTDVTAEVADVDSRVASAQAVLVTFRERLPQARTIPDVLAVEGEIARRQADLEALQARQRVLADQAALATVDVTLTAARAPALAASAQPGFTGGLAAGWRALGEVARVLTLVLGAVLPFLLPLAVVGVPLLVLRRRRLRSAGPGRP